MKRIRAVFFDVDGVLVDSLAAHLRICEDTQRAYGLHLRLPSPEEFKKMVRAGVRISPMERMFAAVGFPDEAARRADLEYQRVFMDRYAPAPFPGVDAMLAALDKGGLPLGYISANVRRNVELSLGANVVYFDSRCRFTKDHPQALSKDKAIAAAADAVGVAAEEVIYVGDLPSDFEAATGARSQFLGVTYGWGISREDVAFPTADHPAAAARYVLDRAGREPPRKSRPSCS